MSASDDPAHDGRQSDIDGGALAAWKIWRIFGEFNSTPAKWYPYWSAQAPVAVQPDAIKVSFYAHEGEDILAVVSNLGRATQTAVVAFDLGALQLDANRISARDAVSNESLPLDAGRLSLSLKPESCRLVLLRKRP
jgi:hypothetical protein